MGGVREERRDRIEEIEERRQEREEKRQNALASSPLASLLSCQ
jgi:hypothetical protein